ncbi:hypothetical protein BT96DRAFT_912814 [Gymnopus androsaceus JB14]|uniref:C2H2-type domain-containing protein n=1 Tax=Gymnopus androsaceus JB14 TaxID=1447944 RepID=A0A6A4ICJ0_9AGAR|nr:hypothetical protein BT96DRAFT_912814 [Gymnopus androsaceus JB14]
MSPLSLDFRDEGMYYFLRLSLDNEPVISQRPIPFTADEISSIASEPGNYNCFTAFPQPTMDSYLTHLPSSSTTGATHPGLLPFEASSLSHLPHRPVINSHPSVPTAPSSSMIGDWLQCRTPIKTCADLQSRDSGQSNQTVRLKSGKPTTMTSIVEPSQQRSGIRKSTRKFECTFCPKIYTAKHNLQSHVDSKHLGIEKKWRCEYCGLGFTGSRACVRHRKNRTNGIRTSRTTALSHGP